MHWIFYTPKNVNIQPMGAEIMSFFHTYASDLLAGKRERNPAEFVSLSYMMVPGTYDQMMKDYG